MGLLKKIIKGSVKEIPGGTLAMELLEGDKDSKSKSSPTPPRPRTPSFSQKITEMELYTRGRSYGKSKTSKNKK